MTTVIRGFVKIVNQPEIKDDAQRFHPVPPTDLLAFFVSTPVIADWHFINTQLPLGALHGDFRFKAKAV